MHGTVYRFESCARRFKPKSRKRSQQPHQNLKKQMKRKRKHRRHLQLDLQRKQRQRFAKDTVADETITVQAMVTTRTVKVTKSVCGDCEPVHLEAYCINRGLFGKKRLFRQKKPIRSTSWSRSTSYQRCHRSGEEKKASKARNGRRGKTLARLEDSKFTVSKLNNSDTGVA